MNISLPPLADIYAHLPASLGSSLIPLAIAVPLALLLIYVVTRPRDDAPPDRTEPPVAARVAVAPVVAATATVAPAAAPAASDALAPLILVVDDSAVARAKLRRLFSTSGYRVEVASDGVEALDLLAKSPVSVLITDLEMPNMNGFELIAHVQGGLDTEDIPIIAITGHDELQARVHDFQNLYGIFKKPWNDRELLKRVQALASLRGSAAQATAAAAPRREPAHA